MIELIRTRRSVRTFTGQPVTDALIEDVLEAGRWAPSGKNNQPWRFAVIRESGIKERLSGLTHYARVVKAADVLIAVFLDADACYDHTKDVQAAGACIQNMLLAAHSLGLGACWLGEILRNGPEVGRLLQTPKGYELMALLAVGHPKETAHRPPARKPLSELVFLSK